MKELFKNTTGYNTVTINLDCRAGNIDLNYQLIDSPVQHLWQDIYLNTNRYKMGYSKNYSSDKILTEFNSICSNVGIEKLPIEYTQRDLNKFHSIVVKLTRETTNENLTLLNSLIHLLEIKLNNKYLDYCASILLFSDDNEKQIPIKEEYKLWLESNTKWGDLFLGYGTLGKDWLDLVNDDDDVSELSIQKVISSETCLSFGVDYNFPKANEILFYRWASKSATKVPLDNLNKLALGRYVLGKLILDDTILNHHSVVGDWYVPNHICKLTWNRDVIGDEVVVKNMKFYNDMKYQEININHAQIRSIL